MKSNRFLPKKVFILKGSEEFSLTKTVLKNISSDTAVQTVSSSDEALREISLSGDPISAGKQILFITKQEGSFLKKCPGTKKVLCCNYYVLDTGENCNFDCTYCFLQHYSNNHLLMLYANTDSIFDEIDAAVSNKNRELPIRIGTGEFTDSLSLDHLTEFSKTLISGLKGRDDVILELKTKSSNIENLLISGGSKNIVISWSLNPADIVTLEEQGTASLEERINCAKDCVKSGFSTAFHFDPIIHFSGWEKKYEEVVDLIFSTINPATIAWISLGALRFTPALKPIIERRFSMSKILGGEIIQCSDGKMRYPRVIREELFRKMNGFIRKHSEKVPVYLCMEPALVWKNTLSTVPSCDLRLNGIFGV